MSFQVVPPQLTFKAIVLGIVLSMVLAGDSSGGFMVNDASNTGSAFAGAVLTLFLAGAAKDADIGRKAARHRAEKSPKREISFMRVRGKDATQNSMTPPE